MYREGVSAIILNGKNKFLLVNLESFETKYFAIPGGGLNSGETHEEAIYREILEELNINRESLELVGKSSSPLKVTFKVIRLDREGKKYIGSQRHFFGFRFIGNDADIKPQKNEVRTYRWVSFAELKNYLLFDNQLEETSEKIIEIFPYVLKAK